MNISEFMKTQTHVSKELNSDFPIILGDIIAACKKIAVAINRGALESTMHSLASENIQGEVQKALDVITNDIFLEANQASGYIAGMASEEMDEPYVIPEKFRSANKAKYLILFDPLDGSNNVNLDMTVGTIFSVLRCTDNVIYPLVGDFLQPGSKQICAGYALYGTSTMLVFTTGNGVDGFTLDTISGEFMLTHPAMQIPKDTQEFAVNMSNYRFWEAPMQDYVDELLQGKEGVRKKDFNMRWVGSMVAEVHRLLIRGGIYLYPLDSKLKKQGGRLRLMYEANPLGFVVEQASGLASTGRKRLLDIKPSELHQRVPVIMGARNEVERLIAYHQR